MGIHEQLSPLAQSYGRISILDFPINYATMVE